MAARPRCAAEHHGLDYVFAVGANFCVSTADGATGRAEELAGLAAGCFERRSWGIGSRGPRTYDYAMIATAHPRHTVLIRRSITDPDDVASFSCYIGPHRPLILARLVSIGGRRRPIEECFSQIKDLIGGDEHQLRRWHSWQRHTALCAAALALLAAVRAAADPPTDPRGRPHTPEQSCPAQIAPIELSIAEIRRLLHLLLGPPPQPLSFHLSWSYWRRCHQARARWHHWQNRLRRANHN